MVSIRRWATPWLFLAPALLVTALIVLLPVAIAPKTGLDAYQPLATTVCGGLLIGTILSLFDIPIMHTYMDDILKWLSKTFLNREWTWPVQPIDGKVSETTDTTVQ